MGTPSLTHIREKENDKDVATIYKHYDGYLDGWGKELKEFLTGFIVVNGISSGQDDCAECGQSLYFHKDGGLDHIFIPKKIANDMGCLAAQIVARFKKSIGNLYLTSPTEGERYEYFIWVADSELMLKAVVYGDVRYSGTLDGFNPNEDEDE